MKKHTVIHPMGVKLHSGRVGLTDKQAAKRIHCLKLISIGKGYNIFDITKEIQLKAGEQVFLPDNQPKALLQQVEDEESAKARTEKAKKTATPEGKKKVGDPDPKEGQGEQKENNSQLL